MNEIAALKELLFKKKRAPRVQPITKWELSGDPSRKNLGRKLIAEGKVACLVAAGGQGTRLGIDGPKGNYPISLIRGKTLFELLSEKVHAAERQAGRALKIAFMCSPENELETKNALAPLFDQNQLSLFVQNTLPFLNEKGEPLEERGPDGNGGIFACLAQSGIWKKWKEAGIEWVNFILIDNPLADPFDAELAALASEQKADVCIKCTYRKSPDEKVGLIVEKQGRPAVVEYSELHNTLRDQEHPLINLSLFTFSMDFIKKMSKKKLPLHKAWKKTHSLGMAWKFERFIFDCLPFSKKTALIAYPRNECFAPLKNKDGEDSPETVKKALQERDREVFKAITGLEPPIQAFELSQSFYYPTKELLSQWRNKKGHQGFIEA